MRRFTELVLRHGFSMGLIIAAAGVLLLGLLLLWRTDGPDLPRDEVAGPGPAARPDAGPSAPGPARLTAAQQAFVKALRADAKRFDVPVEPARYFAPFPVWLTKGQWKLRARQGRLLTKELRITTSVRTMDTPLGGLGTYRAQNLILTVENRTDHHIAFRVLTVPSGEHNCRPKAALAQPTLVLGPREALSRTECLVKGRDHLTIRRIDVMAIPAVSYHYLLKLKPVTVGIPARVAEGHTLPRGYRYCSGVPRQQIEQAIRKGQARWIDVIDFYARYNCDRFDFRVGYRRPGPAPQPSPVLFPKAP